MAELDRMVAALLRLAKRGFGAGGGATYPGQPGVVVGLTSQGSFAGVLGGSGALTCCGPSPRSQPGAWRSPGIPSRTTTEAARVSRMPPRRFFTVFTVSLTASSTVGLIPTLVATPWRRRSPSNREHSPARSAPHRALWISDVHLGAGRTEAWHHSIKPHQSPP